MSTETWATLPFSQDNPQTIGEYVAQEIASHEESPESHLGPGESIEVHRTDPTLDHPAGSALADKGTMTEVYIDDPFTSLTQYQRTGVVDNSDWPSVSLYVEYGVVNKSQIALQPQTPSPFLDYDYDSMFQIFARFDLGSTNFKAWLGLGMFSDVPIEGYGFVLTNNVLKAVVAVSNTRVYSDPIAITVSQNHIYRAQLNSQEGFIYYYIDGTLVATLSVPGTSPDSDGGPVIGLSVSSANDGSMYIADLNFSRSVV